MKGIRLLAFAALLHGHAAVAEPEAVPPLRLDGAAAVRDAGDRLARCAGVYRGAAEIMRRTGRDDAADYAENVGFGALFAAYLVVTSPAAEDAKLFEDVDPNVHIEALAWGSERNFVMLEEQAEAGGAEQLRACAATSELQSSLLRGALPVLAGSAPAAATAPSAASAALSSPPPAANR